MPIPSLKEKRLPQLGDNRPNSRSHQNSIVPRADADGDAERAMPRTDARIATGAPSAAPPDGKRDQQTRYSRCLTKRFGILRRTMRIRPDPRAFPRSTSTDTDGYRGRRPAQPPQRRRGNHAESLERRTNSRGRRHHPDGRRSRTSPGRASFTQCLSSAHRRPRWRVRLKRLLRSETARGQRPHLRRRRGQREGAPPDITPL